MLVFCSSAIAQHPFVYLLRKIAANGKQKRNGQVIANLPHIEPVERSNAVKEAA
jgi:hypothetical protein